MAIHPKFVSSVVVVINTGSYTGNFCRQLCAYVSGVMDEMGISADMAWCAGEELSLEEQAWFEEHAAFEVDPTNECTTPVPVSIWPSSVPVEALTQSSHANKVEYNSVGLFYDEAPPAFIMDRIKERVLKFATTRPDWQAWMGEESPIDILDIHVLVPTLVEEEVVVYRTKSLGFKEI